IQNSQIEDEEEDDLHLKTRVKMIVDPMYGAVPVTEATQIGRNFKLWIGHTNFNITRRISNIIEQTKGVEVLNIITRYRFRIGVGTTFCDRTTMNRIENNIKKKNK